MSQASDRIRLAAVSVGDRERDLIEEVLSSGRLAQGPMVERLEAAFAARVGVAEAVAVSNGTTALVAALTAHGIGRGDEVIVAPLTFGATLNAVLAVGATARFADVLPDYTMDPESMEALVGPRTAAVIPVHLYGQCADMPEIRAVADRHGLVVIEDAAQAIAASVAGTPAGAWGTGCFSLYATKNVMAGEGGIVTTDDPSLADRLRILRNQGMRGRYDYVSTGLNWRLSDLHAAVGVGQMERLDEMTTARRANAAALDRALASTPWLETPVVRSGAHHVYHQYTIRVDDGAPVDRDGLARLLDHAGIDTGVVYPRVVFDYDCFLDHPDVVADTVPTATRAARSVLSLPVHPAVTADDVDRIAGAIASATRMAA